MTAQSESPVTNHNEIRKMYEQLHRVFPIVSTYTSNMPTYPGGYWSWGFCSDDVEIPLDYTLSKALAPKSDSVVYQNKEIHIIPWAKGGETTLENLQVLCSDCNATLGDLDK